MQQLKYHIIVVFCYVSIPREHLSDGLFSGSPTVTIKNSSLSYLKKWIWKSYLLHTSFIFLAVSVLNINLERLMIVSPEALINYAWPRIKISLLFGNANLASQRQVRQVGDPAVISCNPPKSCLLSLLYCERVLEKF